jgi:hypothetical protein
MKPLIAIVFAMNLALSPELLAVGLMLYAIVPVAVCLFGR